MVRPHAVGDRARARATRRATSDGRRRARPPIADQRAGNRARGRERAAARSRPDGQSGQPSAATTTGAAPRQRLPPVREVVEIARGHHPDHQPLAVERRLAAAHQLGADVGPAAVAHHQVDGHPELAARCADTPACSAVGELVDAGEAVAEHDDRAVGIVFVEACRPRARPGGRPASRADSAPARLGQAREKIAVAREGSVLLHRLRSAPRRPIPGIASHALGDGPRRELEAAGGPVRVLPPGRAALRRGLSLASRSARNAGAGRWSRRRRARSASSLRSKGFTTCPRNARTARCRPRRRGRALREDLGLARYGHEQEVDAVLREQVLEADDGRRSGSCSRAACARSPPST